jgi:hypothetical protein
MSESIPKCTCFTKNHRDTYRSLGIDFVQLPHSDSCRLSLVSICREISELADELFCSSLYQDRDYMPLPGQLTNLDGDPYEI